MVKIVKSILSDEDRCYICGSYDWIETHHIFGGNPNRRISDENGFTVRLCHWCHNEPPRGVHHNRQLDLWLKQKCQQTFEQTHTREEFISLIGKNYL